MIKFIKLIDSCEMKKVDKKSTATAGEGQKEKKTGISLRPNRGKGKRVGG